MLASLSSGPRTHRACVGARWAQPDRPLPQGRSLLVGAVVIVEVSKTKPESGFSFARRRTGTAGRRRRPGPRGLWRKRDRCAVSRSSPRCGDEWRFQREEEAFPCEAFCVPVVGRPGRTDGIGPERRVAAVIAVIRICLKPRCGGGPMRPLPHERGGVRARGPQSPVRVERWVSPLSRRARIIRLASAAMPVLHVSVGRVCSGALFDFASRSPFLDTSRRQRTSCVRTRAPWSRRIQGP
ncbi:hypothetical protein TcYC6_0060870 [Trypanosoma cruzi]|nr:hypothetical protein - Trypanosoma cruzi [Trypanosoma cruzi]KAF8300207.1 hypothetical protein TcYC6_0060870 [Trypanosoma cruzi]RNC53699.1 hypothetical protein TcCL_ESM08939 [Trypanosoma cruzi]